MRRPSGLQEMPYTLSVCPRRLSSSVPVLASQTLTTLACPDDASRFSSGLQATHSMDSTFGRHATISFPAASEILMPSALEEASRRPVGLQATHSTKTDLRAFGSCG